MIAPSVRQCGGSLSACLGAAEAVPDLPVLDRGRSLVACALLFGCRLYADGTWPGGSGTCNRAAMFLHTPHEAGQPSSAEQWLSAER